MTDEGEEIYIVKLVVESGVGFGGREILLLNFSMANVRRFP